MTLALRIWLRRSTATLAFPALVLTELIVLFSRSGWNHEWGWSLSEATDGTILLAPMAAGLVAFDRARRVEPTLAFLGSGAVRGPAGDVVLVAAGWISATAAWGVGVVVAGTLARLGGATGWPEPAQLWVLLEGLVLLGAGACLGLLVGAGVGGLLAGPVAAIGFFLARIFADSAGLETAFSAGGAVGSLLGERRIPSLAMAVIGFHLAVGVLALVASLLVLPARRVLPVRIGAGVMVGAVVIVAGSVLVSQTQAQGGNLYEWTSAPRVCLAGEVRVCGPAEARYVLRASQRSLTSALEALSGSGIDWQRTYVVAAGRAVSPNEGILFLATEDISHGRLGTGRVAQTLGRPRLCRAFFGERPPPGLLDDEGVVQEWVARELASGGRPGPAPAPVRRAYDELRHCTPMTEALP